MRRLRWRATSALISTSIPKSFDQVDEICLTHMRLDHLGELTNGSKKNCPNAFVRARLKRISPLQAELAGMMILTKFQILFRLLVARHRIGFKSSSERLAFYLQINPVLNVLTSLWMSSISDGNGITGRWARRLVTGGFGFGALRNMSPENRVIFATNVLGIHSKPGTGTVLTKIETDGYAALTKFVDSSTVYKAHEFFGSCDHFAAQVFAQSDGVPIKKDWRDYGTPGAAPPFRYVCFRLKDSLRFFEQTKAIDIAAVKKIADTYCGFDTRLYGVNTFCTLPGVSAGYAMRLHRDYDDFSFLTVFIAWTATSAEDGATLYVPRSHRSSTAGTQTVALAAQPGDAFIADTFGLHAGNIHVEKPRLATWFRFGHKVNLATIQDGE